jgi:hypothetical protein
VFVRNSELFIPSSIRNTFWPLQVKLHPALPWSAGRLCHGASAQQMDGKEHDSHNEGDVDESRSNVKREKPEQPKNN